MPTSHTILEIRTGRDSQHTPETAVQLFATIPRLKNTIFDKLSGTNESLSFEIVVQNQTIFFICHSPTRLIDYIKASLAASYPEAVISIVQNDPLEEMWQSYIHPNPNFSKKNYLNLGKLELNKKEYLPLKTFQDFKDIDPLVTVLSTLSKTEELDQAVIQFVIDTDTESWKNKGYHKISQLKESKSSVENVVEELTKTSNHPQKSLIEKKLQSNALRVAIKIAVLSTSQEKSNLLIENLATAFNSMSQSRSNYLWLRKIYFAKEFFFKTMLKRSFFLNKKMHFSLEELATLYHLPNQQLTVIPNIAWGKKLLGDPPENLPVITRYTPPALKNNANVFAQTVFKNANVKYAIKRNDRRRHMYVIGKTGTGKSTLLANMAINDLKNDEGICIVDPHGDLVETLLDYIPSRRINDVIYFNPADVEKTVQINLFEGENVIHRELIASGIVSIFHKLYEYSWGPRLEYILRNSLLTLLKSEDSKLSDVLELLTNKRFRNRIIEKLNDPILKSFWVDEFNNMQDRQRTEAIAPILNKVGQFVTSPLVRNVVNAPKSSFSIEDIMSKGKILLCNLSQGRLGEDNATLLGAMLITKIQLAAMGRVSIQEEKRKDFYLYVDEFQNFATQSFIKILSEARKYRLNLTLANQYIAQIPEEVQKAIFGNCGTIISFVMGADDSAAFESEYAGKYTKEDLVSLGRYQIVNKLTIDDIISRPFPAFTLPLAKSFNGNRDKVIRVSRERYARDKS
jgi:type IV secretion system coupling TraD/TrwB family protein